MLALLQHLNSNWNYRNSNWMNCQNSNRMNCRNFRHHPQFPFLHDVSF
jgi:hypothetical protein